MVDLKILSNDERMKLIFFTKDESKFIGIRETSEIYLQLNILAHTQLLEFPTGSRCGGHGVCGADLIRIPIEVQKKFFNEPREKELEHLSEQERADGLRLACQCFINKVDPHTEVNIEIL